MSNGGFDATMGPASTTTAGGGGTVVAGANIIVTSGSTVAVANSPTISVVTTTAPALFNGGTHIPASFPTATALAVTSDSGAVATTIDTFGGVPRLISRRANGTPAAPSGAILNDTLFSTMSFGYGASAYSTGGRALFNVIATENWSNTAQGAAQTFQVTANGGTVTTEAMRLNHNGDLLIGSTTDAGTGKLQVTGTAAIDVLTLGTTAPFHGIGSGLSVASGLLTATGGSSGVGLFSTLVSALPTVSNTGLSNLLGTGAASTNAAGGLLISGTSGGMGAYVAAPAPTYTKSVLVSSASFLPAIGWTDGTKVTAIILNSSSGSTIQNFTNVTTFSTQTSGAAQGLSIHSPFWLQLSDNGVTVTMSVSPNGVDYLLLTSITKIGSFLGATGFANIFCGILGGSGVQSISVLGFV